MQSCKDAIGRMKEYLARDVTRAMMRWSTCGLTRSTTDASPAARKNIVLREGMAE